MKRVRAFKNIWNVARHLYVGFGNLKFPFSYRFIGVFMVAEISILFLNRVIKYLPWGDNPLMWYLCVPGLLAYFMDKKTLDDKRPYSFLKTVIVYVFRSKNTYMGHEVTFRKENIGKKERITTVEDVG